ncbi:MAG TPA: IMP dehydrogenase [Pseudomonadota bacterium]|nr:IMP dehydrogenase [Pseudomonadota bacterium]
MEDNQNKPIWKKERLLRITWEVLGQLMDRMTAFVETLTPRPQVVVGIVRGGLCPAVQVSHALGTRECYLLDVVRNTQAEGRYSERGEPQLKWDLPAGVVAGKDVLLVDDIAGDGGTLRLTVRHLKDSGAASVRTAVLVRNQGCTLHVDFFGVGVDDWVVFPWERPAAQGSLYSENLALSAYRRPDRALREGLTFDDVLLVPHRTRARTRGDVSLASRLTATIPLQLPFLSANAPWCTEAALAIAMARLGGMGFVHRMCSIEHQAKQVEQVKAATVDLTQHPQATVDQAGKLRVGAAIGVNGNYMERAHRLAEAGSDVFVLDIAHGHADYALTVLGQLKAAFPKIPVIAGNVATAAGTRDLSLAGADAVKVGIGPGSACTTRVVTGAGVPQLTAVIDCVEEASKYGVPVIADGGLRRSGDVVKALAAGAATVMFGGMLAGTDESAAELVEHEGTRYKVTTGYASLGMKMTLKRERGEEITQDEFEAYAPEGAEVTFPYTGSAREVLLRCAAGVRSGFSYSGAMSLDELVKKAEFIRITAATQTENQPHMLDGKKPKLHREYRSTDFSRKL